MYGFKAAGENAGSAFYEISKAYPGLSNNFGIISSLDCYISSIFGVLMGFLVDKYNRKNILGGIVILCSMASVATGTINSLGVLIAMRLVLGMCQSGFMPAIYSLVQDTFPKNMRSRANSVISCGNYIGDSLASLYIIFIAQYGWRSAQNNIGYIGLLIGAAVLFFLREPSRSSQPSEEPSFNLKEGLSYIFKNKVTKWVIIGDMFKFSSPSAFYPVFFLGKFP